jgi:hypothetical protein
MQRISAEDNRKGPETFNDKLTAELTQAIAASTEKLPENFSAELISQVLCRRFSQLIFKRLTDSGQKLEATRYNGGTQVNTTDNLNNFLRDKSIKSISITTINPDIRTFKITIVLNECKFECVVSPIRTPEQIEPNSTDPSTVKMKDSYGVSGVYAYKNAEQSAKDIKGVERITKKTGGKTKRLLRY